MLSRRTLAVAAASLALAVLAGCAPETGTVTSTYYTTSGNSSTYYVCAKDGQGHKGCDTVLRDEYDRCHKGDAWPACKKGRKS